MGNEWIAKVNGIINYKERIFTYESDYEMNQIPISCWQKFQDPKKVYEIEPYDKNGMYELELEENENEEEHLIKMFEIKEQPFNKVKIEDSDIMLSITEEKQTVTGQINDKQKEQLHELLQKYEDVIAKEEELGRTDVY